MSKERELLQRVIAGDDDGDFFISHRLYKDIETFLAQPELSDEQKRLAAIAIKQREAHGITGGGE